MKIGDAFPGNYVKVDDLKGRRVTVTIDHVKVETLGRGENAEEKPVVYFVGSDKGLALNRTNANTIVDLLGTDETEEWAGKKITLYPDKTDFQGKRVACIRIAPAAAGRTPAPPPPVQEQPEPGSDFEASNDDVPFSLATFLPWLPLVGAAAGWVA